jgi:ribosome assembly protein YihI (activator of Der GTPase)
METNTNYYNAILHLIEASTWLREVDNKTANNILDKAEFLMQRLVIVDEKDKEEIEKYELLLKSK